MTKVLIILAFICGNVSASDWQKIYADQDEKLIILVDKQSITALKGMRKAWLAYNYSTPQKTTGYPYSQFSSTKDLVAFNCAERTSAVLQYTLYAEIYAEGAVIETRTFSKDKLQFSDAVPDSIGEGNLNFICAYKLKSK